MDARAGALAQVAPRSEVIAPRCQALEREAPRQAGGDATRELRGLDRATIVRLRREKFTAVGRTLG